MHLGPFKFIYNIICSKNAISNVKWDILQSLWRRCFKSLLQESHGITSKYSQSNALSKWTKNWVHLLLQKHCKIRWGSNITILVKTYVDHRACFYHMALLLSVRCLFKNIIKTGNMCFTENYLTSIVIDFFMFSAKPYGKTVYLFSGKAFGLFWMYVLCLIMENILVLILPCLV
jgi:hypothetical protein